MPAFAHWTAKAELEDWQHFLQCAAVGAQDNSEAHVSHAATDAFERDGCFFPFVANFAEKIRGIGSLLGDDFVAARTIDADRRRVQHYLRRVFGGSEKFTKFAGSIDPAGANFFHALFGPFAAGDIFASQMDQRIGGNTAQIYAAG